MLSIDFDEAEGLYRALDKTNELTINQNRETSHVKIEIVPFDRNDFDFVSFIDFANLTSSSYYVDEVKTMKDKSSYIYVHSNIYKNSLRQPKYSFHVKFGYGMSSIHVYVKYAMADFHYKNFKGYLCINIKSNGMSANDSLAQYWVKNERTLLYQVAKYYKSHTCKKCIQCYFEQYLGQNTITPLQPMTIGRSNSIKDILSYCPGFINITYQPKKNEEANSQEEENNQNEANSQEENNQNDTNCKEEINNQDEANNHEENANDNKEKANEEEDNCEEENYEEDVCCEEEVNIEEIVDDEETEYNLDQDELQKISIVFPWAEFILDQCHYIELDASFYGTKPYSYCVMHAIFLNESIPVSLSIAPTECSELYLASIRDIQKISNDRIHWHEKVVLSDMGKSIKSACKKFNIEQYFCHRHILEYFGSSCVLGLFCSKLLKCKSFVKYEQVRLEIFNELRLYEEERKALGTYSKEFKKKVKDLTIMLNGYDADSRSNYHVSKWGLWIRREKHVGRCSNHEEGFHSYVNRSLGNQYGFNAKLLNLIDSTLRQARTFNNKRGSSIKRKRRQIIDKLIKKLEEPSFKILSVCNEDCDCEEDIWNYHIFGTKIPCKHQLLTPARTIIIEIKKFINQNKINCSINSLILQILRSKFLKVKENDDISKITRYIFQHELGQDIDFNLMCRLVYDIRFCLAYSIPEYPQFEIDWSINTIKEFRSSKRIEFDSKNVTVKPSCSFKISKEDQSVWTSNCSTFNQTIAKKSLYETIMEVIFVYPELNKTTIPFSICFDEFISIIDFKDDLHILETIPLFKINCWKSADRMMKSNRFFK